MIKKNNIKKLRQFFLKTKTFGELYITDVLLIYIYPRYFICDNEVKEKYLVTEIEIDVDKEPGISRWLIKKIDEQKYQEIKSKKCSIQEPFRNAKDKYYIFDLNHDTYILEEEEITELPEDLVEWFNTNETFAQID